MPFATVARLAGLSQHRVQALFGRHVDLAREDADLSGVRAVAIDDIYEEPLAASLIIDTTISTVEECMEILTSYVSDHFALSSRSSLAEAELRSYWATTVSTSPLATNLPCSNHITLRQRRFTELI